MNPHAGTPVSIAAQNRRAGSASRESVCITVVRPSTISAIQTLSFTNAWPPLVAVSRMTDTMRRPEVALSIGYRITPAATVYVGYSFLYASDVARPGEQINRNINPTQTVSYGNDPPVNPQGPAQPTFAFNTTDFWAQTLTVGINYRF